MFQEIFIDMDLMQMLEEKEQGYFSPDIQESNRSKRNGYD